MLLTKDLKQIIFNMHSSLEEICDELIIISGYLGPGPVKELSKLPFKTTVVYGMYGSESISSELHMTLSKYHSMGHCEIYYSNIPIHSKCYIWKSKGRVIYALIGSANFSTNGLTIPFREVLGEITSEAFEEIETYIKYVISNSILCTDSTVVTLPIQSLVGSENVCNIVLYDPISNEVGSGSGLNWGNGNGHNRPGDSYITIRTKHIREYPKMFPPKQKKAIKIEGRSQRQNDSIELIWDDGTVMNALLEGSQPVDGLIFPKQLSSSPVKNILGHYIRGRLNLAEDAQVSKSDLDRYGRDSIDISLLQDGTYFVDFSV